MVRQYFPGKVGKGWMGIFQAFRPKNSYGTMPFSVESGCDRACACMQIAKNIFRTLQRHLRQRWRELCEQFVVFPCLFMVFVGLEKGESFFKCVLCHIQEPVLAVILRTGGWMVGIHESESQQINQNRSERFPG